MLEQIQDLDYFFFYNTTTKITISSYWIDEKGKNISIFTLEYFNENLFIFSQWIVLVKKLLSLDKLNISEIN